MNWETYTAFGDSITIGARSYLGYPEVAAARLEQELDKHWDVVNCAVSGITTIELARLIDQQYSHLKAKQSSISTILIGTNDVKKNTGLKDFEIALNLVIIKVKLLTQAENVVVLQIPKLQKGIMYPYNYEMNDTIAVYNQAICAAANHHHVKTMELQLQPDHFLDGVHLNNEGAHHAGGQIAEMILTDRGMISAQ